MNLTNKFDWIRDVLYKISLNKELKCYRHGEDNVYREAIDLSLEKGFIEVDTNKVSKYKLTKSGHDFFDSGLEYPAYLALSMQQHKTHIGHNISHVQNSSLNIDSNLDKQSNNNIKAQNPAKKSKIEPVYMIVGIIVSILGLLIALYEFWLKHVFIK